MVFLYNLFIRLYLLGIRITSLWNKKAREWLHGRANLFENLEASIAPTDQVIWVHCASAGELEQGKPVIEALKKEFPQYKILVSFFSPSGYQVGKKYKGADLVTYLPADTRKHAKRFIDLVHPSLVVFIKYEYWYHHLAAAAFHHIPVILVSAIFRETSLFFKWYGRFHRQMLFLFRQIFVQDEASRQRLATSNIHHCTVSGDTRFDRVLQVAAQFTEPEVIPQFVQDAQVIVAGSTWPDDEKLLATWNRPDIKLIIAPHEIHPAHIHSIQQLFPGAFRYSALKGQLTGSGEAKTAVWNQIHEQQVLDLQHKLTHARVLIIDNIGMLSRLYHYATVSYIGGGFNRSGIHNTLEAAVYGKPVLFGPQYHKFREAKALIEAGAAVSIQNAEELKAALENYLSGEEALHKAGKAAANYVLQNAGASETVIKYIQEKRLLTR